MKLYGQLYGQNVVALLRILKTQSLLNATKNTTQFD